MKFLSQNLAETEQIAYNYISTLKSGEQATVIALHGDLGAGKTAFSQAVGKVVGVNEDMHSPTFVIEKIYAIDFQGFRKLVHIDAYRLEKESELVHLGWEEVIQDQANLILIEWPENVPGVIPDSAKRIFFKFIDENTREISYEDER